MAHYTQCKMTRPANGAADLPCFVHVAWIPSEFAKVGRKIEIEQNGEWTDWTVTATWATKDAKTVEQRGHDSTKGFGSAVK